MKPVLAAKIRVCVCTSQRARNDHTPISLGASSYHRIVYIDDQASKTLSAYEFQ